MIIETKFNKGDNVLILNDSKLLKLPVKNIEFLNGAVYYSFLICPAATSLDRDEWEQKREDECFANIDELYKKFIHE